MTEIPFLDLATAHLELETELVSVFRAALRNSSFIGGSNVDTFEREYADFCGTKHCVGVGSGTDALRFALMAAGVKPGDVVITVPNTFIATAEAISQAGALPTFVDIDDRTYNLDPQKLRGFLEAQCDVDERTGAPLCRGTGRRITAIVPVHLYGLMADMDPILDLAEKYHLTVIEDACQAHGAQYFSEKESRWRMAGSMGKAAAFSYYPGKNLGACGDAGAVTTDDPEVAQKVKILRDHGQRRKYFHDVEGYNGRLDAIQAGILRVKLAHLKAWNARRRLNASTYNHLMHELNGIEIPYQPSWAQPVFHLYVVRSKERDDLQRHLNASGIRTGIHYPVPLHLQEAYKYLGHTRGDFPVAEAAASQVLSLPMYPQLRVEQQLAVCSRISTHQFGRAALLAATKSAVLVVNATAAS
jgi:dTDP-4-amino-4,6-dideoxygalactose transaminase